MKFAKLLSDDGSRLPSPDAVDSTVSFDVRDGVAQAWGPDGKTMLANLVSARVSWIGPKGMRIEGMEPFDRGQITHFRAMQWQVSF